ncbi:SDR family oxidoreductase [Candidatus Bathyarchaeota archaeon]|nr:SDR family oxidoreductase [Candidatus Bathyarchaeota archaeon]
MTIHLRDRVILITGSSVGIGRETAYEFAKEGCKVVVTYYQDRKEAEEVGEKCLAIGAPDVLVTQLNLMDDDSIRNTVKKTVERFGEISVLINNAGVMVRKHLRDQSFKEIEDQIGTNLEGLMKMTKESLPYVKDTIINIGSGMAFEGHENATSYCATKFGVRGFSRALSKELPNVKVYAVHPTATATRMNNFSGKMPPEKVAKVILNTAKGEYKVDSGGDVRVEEVLASQRVS